MLSSTINSVLSSNELLIFQQNLSTVAYKPVAYKQNRACCSDAQQIEGVVTSASVSSDQSEEQDIHFVETQSKIK